MQVLSPPSDHMYGNEWGWHINQPLLHMSCVNYENKVVQGTAACT